MLCSPEYMGCGIRTCLPWFSCTHHHALCQPQVNNFRNCPNICHNFCFCVRGKKIKTNLFVNDVITIIMHVIFSPISFPQTQIQNGRLLLRFQIPPDSLDGNYLMRLQSETPVFKFLLGSAGRALVSYAPLPRLTASPACTDYTFVIGWLVIASFSASTLLAMLVTTAATGN